MVAVHLLQSALTEEVLVGLLVVVGASVLLEDHVLRSFLLQTFVPESRVFGSSQNTRELKRRHYEIN